MITPEQRAKINEYKKTNSIGTTSSAIDRVLARAEAYKNPIPNADFSKADASVFKDIQQQPGLMSSIQPSRMSENISAFKTSGTETVQDIGQTFQGLGETVGKSFEGAKDLITNPEVPTAQKISGTLGKAGEAVGGVIGELTIGAGKALLSQEQEDKFKSVVQEAMQSDGLVPQTIKGIQNWYDTLDPVNKRNVDALGGMAQVIGELWGLKVGKEVVKEGLGASVRGIEGAGNIAEQGIKTASTGIDTLQDATRASRIAKQEARVNEAVGRIVQGTPEDIAQAKKALIEVDTEGVKTYSDLNTRIDSNIEALSKRQDAELSQYTDVYRKDQLARYKEVKGIDGKITTASDSPIVDALEQLNAYYTKVGDISKSTVVRQYINKLNTDGLTVNDMNIIARMHGVDLNAYNANGELASGLTKQAAENTRQGIKETLRQRLPNEVSKDIDESLSNLYATQRLTKDMENKVQKLYQKIKNRTLTQKVGGAVADIVDLASFGTLRGFIQKLLPSNVGLKTANSMDLEGELSKNLKEIDKLLAIQDEKKFSEAVGKYLKETQPGMSTRVVSGLSEVEKDNLLGKLQNVTSKDVVKNNQIDLELSDRLDALKMKSQKGSLTEREYAELKVLMDEVEQGANQTISPSFKSGEIPTTKGAPLADTSGGFEGAQQAKASGKTFEEWVKAQGKPYHHYTNADFDEFKTNAQLKAEGVDIANPVRGDSAGIYFFDSTLKGDGGFYGKNRIEAYLDIKNPKKVSKDFNISSLTQSQIDYYREQGFDAIVSPKETVVFDPSQIKTKSQLKAEWDAVSTPNPLYTEARKYKSAEEFVKAIPQNVKVWKKSKFSNDGGYADVPVIRKEENITLYQGGNGEARQFWTPSKKYAEQFGSVTEKTGSFYQIDNGNRMTNVYIQAPTKSQLTDIWKEANKK